MHHTLSQKIAQILIGIIFLAGSIAVVWQFHDKAYDDLPTFYWGTHLAFEEGVSAYQPQYFQQLGQSLDRKIYPFLYPPPSLIIFSPFLLGNYEHVKAIFTLCNLVLWWVLTWLMYRLYCFYIEQKKHFLASLFIPLWSLCFVPVIDTFRTGQVNLFVLACVSPLFFQPSRHRWQVLSGVLFAIAIVLKVYLILGLLVLMITGQKKILAVALGALCLLCAASLIVLPEHIWSEWLALGRSGGGYGKQLPFLMTIPWNQSINGFFIRQFLDERILSGATYWHWPIYICSCAVLLLTFNTVFGAGRRRGCGSSMALTLIFLTAVIVAPLSWLHHYVFAMPAVICCFSLVAKLENSVYTKMTTLAAVVSVIFMGIPLVANKIFPGLSTWTGSDGFTPFTVNLVISAQLLGALVFWVLLSLLMGGRETRVA